MGFSKYEYMILDRCYREYKLFGFIFIFRIINKESIEGHFKEVRRLESIIHTNEH